MGTKIIVRRNAGEDELPKEDWEVHVKSSHDKALTLCHEFINYDDDGHISTGEKAIEETKLPVNCPWCIDELETVASFKKKNGKWY